MDSQNHVLVTGSLGLIGSLLVRELTANGIKVLELDNRAPRHQLNHGDVRDPLLLQQLVKNCRGIIHLAAVSRVVWGEQDPQLCWDVNVNGTQNILETAYQAPHNPWVIVASSREVYGQQTSLPVTEDANLIPLNIYARSKVAGENLVNQYRAQGLTTAILRFSSVYGHSNDYADRVIPAFCRAALLNNPLRIDGFNNVFDFTHVKDTVAGIIQVMQKLNAQVNNLPPIHFTTEQGTTLLQVALLIEKILGRKISYQEAPVRTYDVHRFYGSGQRAENLLAWKANITLEQGLADLLQQFQKQFSLLTT